MKITRTYEFDDDFISSLKSYGDTYPGWGNLHIVMEDGNLEDNHIKWCRDWAAKEGDTNGAELADKIYMLTDEERSVLYNLM